MKNKWILWVFILALTVIVLIVVNNQITQDSIPLSQLIPEGDTLQQPVIEYEFVTEEPRAEAKLLKLPSGVQNVLPEKIQPAQRTNSLNQPTPKISQETQGKFFTIQVASFKDRNQAQQVLEQISKEGLPGFIMDRDLGEKGKWYRVCVGKFDTRVPAEELLAKIKITHETSFILSASQTP